MEAPNCNGLNATECLLRVTASILDQLREESRDFNWDPASFVVTLVIGIIAAAFAFFAIIQGFLAAGPGRHKCSKYAIGAWARLSERQFDWSELRYRSIAQTPVIDVASLITNMTVNHGLVEWRKGDSEYWDIDPLFPKFKHDHKGISDYFPATWLKLLTCTGLHHPELWCQRPQGTDYLPSDLAAAPAYSTVADLVIIASIAAGEIRFDRSGQSTAHEASMQGECIDVNFRNHPLLGMYGSIDQARMGRNYVCVGRRPKDNILFYLPEYRRPSAERLLHKIASSQGFLFAVQPLNNSSDFFAYTDENWNFSAPRKMAWSFTHDLVTKVYESPCHCQPTGTTQVDALRGQGEIILEWCQTVTTKRLRVGYMVYDYLSLREGGISVLAAAVPLSDINLFPKQLAGIDENFAFLAVLSRYCMNANISLSQDIVERETSSANITTGVENQHNSAFRVNRKIWLQCCTYTKYLGRPGPSRLDPDIFLFNQNLKRSPIQGELHDIDSWIEKTGNWHPMMCRIMALAFTAAVCKQMYQGNQLGRKWPDTCVINPEERHDLDETYDPGNTVPNSFSAITELVSRQVRKLREYQDNLRPGEVSVDQYFTRSCARDEKTSQLLDRPFRFLEYMEHITNLWEKDGDDFKYPTNEVQHHLDDLLIYRATLMHMIISQAADNSHILSNPNYYKLIPVI
ncbi:hypothetical protein DER45DRAFT_574564 [Fusarium avenaceum]|nr:hypothetical protein DER45DRAFT_574564 [Fusarium avenaceum]